MKPVEQFAGTHSHKKLSSHHEHEKITTFSLNGKTYDGMLHTLQNYYGGCAGFVVELRDETEHYRALELFEHYNQELSADVTAKTEQIASMQEKIILGMAQIIESRDLSTGGHIKLPSGVIKRRFHSTKPFLLLSRTPVRILTRHLPKCSCNVARSWRLFIGMQYDRDCDRE